MRSLQTLESGRKRVLQFDVQRMRRVFTLSLPLMGVMLSQNLLGIIDTLMVGRFGDEALAGIGVSSVLMGVFLAFYHGVDSTVQAATARRVGEDRADLAIVTLKAGLMFALLSGVALYAFGLAVLPYVLSTAVSDPSASALGIEYLGMRLPALIFVGMAYTFSAFWNGSGVPRWSFGAMVVLLVSNTFFNYTLIFGKLGVPAMGAAGAGLGSAIASFTTLIYHLVLARVIKGFGVGRFNEWIDFTLVKDLFARSLPISLQQMSLYVGMSTTMLIFGMMGLPQLAAVNVIFVILSLQTLPAVGTGLASATLVGQALGRSDADDALRWGWDAAKLACSVILPFSLFLVLVPEFVLRFFVVNEDTVDIAAIPLQILAGGMCLDTLAKVLNFSLRGAGALRVAAAVPFFMQWIVGLPFYWFVGVHLERGLGGVAMYMVLVYGLEAAISLWIWGQGSWREVRI